MPDEPLMPDEPFVMRDKVMSELNNDMLDRYTHHS